jgi:hypothetical protein
MTKQLIFKGRKMKHLMTGKPGLVLAMALVGCHLSCGARAASNDVQMLPPTNIGQNTLCSGAGMLLYDWDTSTGTAIHCVPNVTGDTNGNLDIGTGSIAVPNGSVTAGVSITAGKSIGAASLALGGTDVTSSTVDLSNAPACAGGSALTKGPNQSYYCISVADIPKVGITTVPTCGPGQTIYFDNVNGFSCENIAFPTPPVCTGNNSLQWTGTAYQCVSTTSTLNLPVCNDNYHVLRSDGANLICSPTFCNFNGDFSPYMMTPYMGTVPAGGWGPNFAGTQLASATPAGWIAMGGTAIITSTSGQELVLQCVDPINNTFTPTYVPSGYTAPSGGGPESGGGSGGGSDD